ncbi:hypothetical protein ASD45_11060 [Pseudolabrys sp. Root1462]|uniref:hypothetical protein n=1 Tax=Pseudolabrys sp. Root1462 TaxID=1736466 RepID=UPI00070301B9|nr:hypothetical protein [Pseudolabrys sp. Root1462]KQZ01329.1 hypothetical protein ASD45_11060 [Pseudolabrys sp. Root1462]
MSVKITGCGLDGVGLCAGVEEATVMADRSLAKHWYYRDEILTPYVSIIDDARRHGNQFVNADVADIEAVAERASRRYDPRFRMLQATAATSSTPALICTRAPHAGLAAAGLFMPATIEALIVPNSGSSRSD